MKPSDLKYAAKVADTYAKLAETVSKSLLKASKDHQKEQRKQMVSTAELCAKILNTK